MEKRQRESEGEREREKVRRGEKAGTRSHLSLLSHCWKQSRQTLCDRRDGGGGYEALFREELASLSLKRNTVKRAVFPPREDDSPPRSAGDAPPRPFYFSPTYPSLRLSSSPRYSLFAPLYSLRPYLYSLTNFLYILPAYCFRCAP